MRIYIFKSDAKRELRAFAGDIAGSKLPGQFRPWHLVGAVGPGVTDFAGHLIPYGRSTRMPMESDYRHTRWRPRFPVMQRYPVGEYGLIQLLKFHI